ncbi:MAG: hypothetical protein HZB26_00205 [Candidatus Hydrogenedentes bacterium]|nr:hypothetical protein [Candidatus Hydrogenedentota bacterium]
MDVIVDGNRNFRLDGNPPDVLSAVAAINDFLHARGRAILTVTADGKRMDSQESVHTIGKRPVAEVQSLEVVSGDVQTMVDESLRELDQVLPELSSACRSLAQVFQSANPADGYDPFEKLAQIWSHIKTREMQIASALEVSLDTLELDGKNIAAMHNELNEYLEEAASALKAGDCVLLGDLLEYELAPRAELEVKIVGQLQALARGRAG